jgi:TP901 family phage tail tape measure protein
MAKKIGIILAVDGEKQFTQAMKNAQSSAKLLSSDMKGLTEKYEGNANSLTALSEKQKKMAEMQDALKRKQEAAKEGLENANKVYREQSERLEALKKKLEEAQKAQKKMEDSGEQSTAEYQKQCKEVEQLSNAVEKQTTERQKAAGKITDWTRRESEATREVNKASTALEENKKYLNEAKTSADSCATSIDKFGNHVSDMTDDLEDASKKTSTFGDMLKADLTSEAIVGGVKAVEDAAKEAAEYAVEVGSSFEAGMSEVAAISGATGSQLEALTKKAKELGNSTKFSASEAASAFTNMSLAGWSVDQSLAGIDGVLQLAAASGMDLADASQAVTDNISAFNLQASDASRIADMMAFAQANSSTTAAELAQSYKNCAASMNSAGQDIETTTSFLEILANNGLRGAEAGTAVAAMMRDMTSKMEDGSIAIGDANVKVMDSNGNFRDMTDVLKDVEKATKGMGDAEKQAALLSTFTSDSIKGLNMILNTGVDTTAEYEEKLRDCSGAAEDMADVMQDNLKGKMTELGSAVEGLGIAVYEKFSGPLQSAAELTTNATSAITNAITPQKDALVEFIDQVADTNEKSANVLEKTKSSVDNAGDMAGTISNLGSRLIELNDVENKSLSQRYELRTIVGELSQQIPEISDAYDEEAGKVKMTNEQIKDLIENQKELLIQNAVNQAAQDLMNQMLDAEVNKMRAAEAMQAAADATKEAQKTIDELQEQIANTPDNDTAALRDLTSQLGVANVAWEECRDTEKEAREEYGNSVVAVKELQDQYDGLEEAGKKLRNETQLSTKAEEKLNSVMKPLPGSVKELADSLLDGASKGKKFTVMLNPLSGEISGLGGTAQDAADQIDDASDTAADAAKKAADAAKEAAEAQRTAAQEILDAYNSTRESIESSLQNKISLFDLFEKEDGGEDVTTEAMNKNLNSQIEAIKKYKENLQKLREMTDEEGKSLVSEDFIQYLESMGMEGANAMEHMVWTWENQGEYGAEQVKGISDSWTEAMDLKEGIAKAEASNIIAYQAAMKEFGSSAEDFTDLRDAIEYAAQYAGEAWQGLTEETRTELDDVIQTASACGVKIPEGLADSISSSATSPEQAIEMMNSAIEGQFDGLAKITEQNGISVPDNLKAGIEAGGQSAVDAYTELIELLAANNVDLETAGKEGGAALGKGTASGIQGESDNTKSTAQKVVESAQKAINDNAGAYSAAGKMLITAMAAGMTFFSYQVSNAAGSAAGSGAGAAAGYEGNYQAVGNQLAIGLARGIAQGKSQAINEAVSMAVEALNAVKKAMGIHSPSKVFEKEVGAQVVKGMAWGIKSNAVLAKNASSKMSQDVLNSATDWLDKYKERQFTSLDDEKYFWKKVSANTKKGTAAYKKAQQEITGINKKILNMQTAANKAAGSVSRTKTQGSGSNQKTVNKTDSEYYSEIYSAVNKHLSNMKVYYNISIQEEEKYWAAVLKKVKKGTQAYTDAYEQWKNAKKSGKSANVAAAEEKKEYALDGGALDTYKQYFKVSERAEVDYWNTVRKKFKRGTKEREEADKKYFQARKTLNESLKNLEDDYLDKVTDINSKLKDDIQDVTDDLKDSIADVTKETQEKIDELNKTYADSVKSRQETIYNSMRLTDKFQSESESGKTLLYNLKTQVVGYDDWKEQLQKLRDKGIDKDLIKELEDMGPEASAMLHVLNNDLPEGMEGKGMTDAELNEYVALWRKKHEISKAEAEKENEGLKKQTEKGIADAKAAGDTQIAQLNKNSEQKIAVLKANAKKEIQAATEEYLNGVNELEKPMNTSLENLANKAGKIGENTVTKYIQGIYAKVSSDNAKSSLLNTTTTITTNLSTLSKDGEKIGKDTLDGILSAMNDSKKIKKYTTAMVKKIVSETKKAAKIKSPSRLMAEEVGEYIPAGVGAGIEENTDTAIKPAQDMIRELVESTTGKSMGNITLEQYLQRIDAGAAQAASTAVQAQTQLPGISVDTGNLASLLAQLIGEVQKVATNTAGSSQIVLDTGKLVGEIAKPISQELALQSRAQSRGRF